MKKLFLFILLSGYTFKLSAQTAPVIPDQQTADGLLQFKSHYYDMIDQWVALPKNPKTGKNSFGFIYVDLSAGYTVNLEGGFGVDAQGHIFRDSTDYIKNSMYKIRLGANTVLVAPIPDNMLADLKVKKVPDWLDIYKRGAPDKNSVAMKVNLGRLLNGQGAPTKALEYLEDAYKTEPHAAGLEFELTYSYNELNQFDKAIAILKAAIAYAPNNSLFYRELGFAYMRGNNFDEAVKAYVKGIDVAKQDPDKSPKAKVDDIQSRTEMTKNLVFVYVQQKQFDKAIALLNDFITESPRNTPLYQLLGNVYFNQGDFDNTIKTYEKAIDNVNGLQSMETKANIAYSIALIYRDQKKDIDQYNQWGRKAKDWAPANSKLGLALKNVTF